jgi:hypothetical protein
MSLPESCPVCGDKPIRPFLYGMVERWPWKWSLIGVLFNLRRPYVSVICWRCKNIIGHDDRGRYESVGVKELAACRIKWEDRHVRGR